MSNVLKFKPRTNAPTTARAKPGKPTKADAAGWANFTDAAIKEWQAKATPGSVFKDTECRGLCVRIDAKGGASFFVYKHSPATGKPVKIRLAEQRTNVKGARLQAAALINQVASGTDVARTRAVDTAKASATAKGVRMTVADLLEKYLSEKRRAGEPLSQATHDAYRLHVPALLGPAFHAPFMDLTPERVRALYQARCVRKTEVNKLGVAYTAGSVSGAHTAIAALSAMVRFFDDLGLPDVVRLTKRKGVTKPAVRRCGLGEDQAQQLLAWLVSRAEATQGTTHATECEMLTMAFTTGLRARTLQLLRWEWMDLAKGTMAIPAWAFKGKKDHVLPIPPHTLAMLKARHKRAGKDAAVPGAVVFASLRDPCKAGKFSEHFKKGLPIACAPHDARKVLALLLGGESGAGLPVPPWYATKLLLTHGANDVTFRNYIQGHPWASLLKIMRPASTAAESWLWQQVGNARTIAAMQKLHVEQRTTLAKTLTTRKRLRSAAKKAGLQRVAA